MSYPRRKAGARFREDTGQWELLIPLPRLQRTIFDLLERQPADEGLTADEIVTTLKADESGLYRRTTEESVRNAIKSMRRKRIPIRHVRGGPGYHLARQ